MQQKRKSCFNCINARIVKGDPGDYFQPPEAAYVEDCEIHSEWFQLRTEEMCDLDWGDEFWIESWMPLQCLTYETYSISRCPHCKKAFDEPAQMDGSWTGLTAYPNWSNESLPVCSERCKTILEEGDVF